MSEFTKGEWTVWNLSEDDDNKGWIIQQGDDGRFIARTCDNTGEDSANARLIAAAPAMYKALKEITTQFKRLDILYSKDQIAIENAEQALALAEGKTP